jgi:hypothetical protein
MAMLRMLGRDVHSNYGPPTDTGGLPAYGSRVIYAYVDENALLHGEEKVALPAPDAKPVTERGPH